MTDNFYSTVDYSNWLNTTNGYEYDANYTFSYDESYFTSYQNVSPTSNNNGTYDPNEFVLPIWRQILWSILFGGMVIVSTVGNLIVIWIVLAHKRMRTPTNYFLVNLSIADAMVSTLNVTFSFTYMLNSHWPFGTLYCKISQFVAILSIGASVFTLMAIAIDRTYTNDYEYADQNDAPTRRRNMNDLSNEEYGHIMLYGEPYSLAEEEAMDREALEEMRAEGLIPDDSQMSADDNETPAEINLEQNSVCLPTTEGPQPDVSSDHTYSLDVISPVNQANETLRLRSILPADEQEYYQGSYSLDVISSMNQANETFRRSILPPDEQEMYESPDGDRRRVQARNILQKNLQPPANFRNLNDLIENGNDIRNHRQSSTSQQNRYIPESIHITEHVMQTGMPSTGREHSSSVGNGSLEIRRDAVNVLRPVPQTTVQPVRVETSTNQKRAQATVTSSTLSKNSPLVQAAASVRQQEKSSAPNQSSGKGNSNSLDAIKEKMESYLTACNEKLQKKPERSPHAGFLSYLGSKMEKVAKERIEALEHDILDLVFRFTNEK